MKNINTLKNSRDFQRVYDRGKSYANRYLVIFFRKNNLNENRAGFVTTKKLGNAVKRNKYRRRLRESYRLYQDRIEKGHDMIFLFRNNIPEIGYAEIDSALKHIVSIAGLRKKK